MYTKKKLKDSNQFILTWKNELQYLHVSAYKKKNCFHVGLYKSNGNVSLLVDTQKMEKSLCKFMHTKNGNVCMLVYAGICTRTKVIDAHTTSVCWSVLECVLECVGLQCVAVCCSVLQCVAVCWSVLQCAAVCCSVSVYTETSGRTKFTHTHTQPLCDAVWCSVLQCDAVCCSVLQCVALCCIVLHCVAVCWFIQKSLDTQDL